MKQSLIPVSKPFLPSRKEYLDMLKDPWNSGILTHHGPLVQRLEAELKSYLKVRNLATITNGTLAIQLAIRSLNLSGEIITSPFTYIATANAIMWEHCKPIFADIDPNTLNIDPARVLEKITKRTSAILPVHVFSNPCNLEALHSIASKHKLKIIYDAAHAFGVRYHGKSIFEYGDVSTLSFHATKLFNTGEGGACISQHKDVIDKIEELRFFGHDKNKWVNSVGTNAKMTEIHAALGLVNLRYIRKVAKDRKTKHTIYRKLLKDLSELTYQSFPARSYNYSYFPIIFCNESTLLKVNKALNAYSIIPRRYFYPSLNVYDRVFGKQKAPVSESISRRILCLPMYYSLTTNQIEKICDIIGKSL